MDALLPQLKKSLEIFSIEIIAESTLGAGAKEPALTVSTYLGVPYALTDMERMLSFVDALLPQFPSSPG